TRRSRSATPKRPCAWGWGPTWPPAWRSRTGPGGRPRSAVTGVRASPPSPRSAPRGGPAHERDGILARAHHPRKDSDDVTRVLLAEDDATISEPLARALRREGYVVTLAEDGRAALKEAVSDDPYDLLVLDLGLPVMDGV